MTLLQYIRWRRHGKRRKFCEQISRWYQNFAKLRSKPSAVLGIELLFDRLVIALRALSISYWLKDVLLETFLEFLGEPEGSQLYFGFLGEEEIACQKTRRKARDWLIDAYCIFQFAILFLLLYPWAGACIVRVEGHLAHYIARYVLFEIYLNLSSIFFLAKFTERPKNINEPSTSVERSLLMLLLNVLQVVMSFAVLYHHFMRLRPADAFFESALIFGTLGYHSNAPRLLVLSQIFLDVVLVVIVFGSVVGQIGPFRKPSTEK